MTESGKARVKLPVSALVPAYNAASTLPRALGSILDQTALPAEIILVDDASTDGTWPVIDQFRAAHPELRIKVTRLERNGGAAEARNFGWELAAHEYIAFLDSDDAWHPRKLELQYAWMAAHPQVALSGHRCEVMAEGAVAPELSFDAVPAAYFGLASFLACNRLSTPSVMVRRSIRQRFAAGKRYSEDYLLWMEIVAAHGAAAFIDLPLAALFKAKYGASGLSGNVWQMQLGEIDTLRRLGRMSTINAPTRLVASAWSWMKFLKRIASLPFVNGRR